MDDQAIQQLLQQILCQQQQLAIELDKLDANTAASQLATRKPSGDLFVNSGKPCSTNSSVTHVDHTEGISNGAAETRLSRSQAIGQINELEQEQFHLSSGHSAIQPATKGSLIKKSLTSLDDVIIPAEVALSRCTDLSVVDPHRPHQSSFAIITRIPDTFTPDASHQMVNNKVSGVSQIDDILVVNQVQEQRSNQSQRSCPGRSTHHLSGHVQVGRSAQRFVRCGLKSNEIAECFAPTDQQTLESTSTGGKALQATISSSRETTTTPDDQLNKRNDTKDFNVFKVHQFADWAWDPGPVLQRVGLPDQRRSVRSTRDQLWQRNDDCDGVPSRAVQNIPLDILLGARNVKPTEDSDANELTLPPAVHGEANEQRQPIQPSRLNRPPKFPADRVNPDAAILRRSPGQRYNSCLLRAAPLLQRGRCWDATLFAPDYDLSS